MTVSYLRYLLPRIILLVCTWAIVLEKPSWSATPETEPLRGSVVKINVISQPADYSIPWNPGRIIPASGTGFIISNNRIMTNAHLAGNARFITVEKEGDSNKYEAKVRFIAHDCDLAILDVLDKSFFTLMVPLDFGGIPSLDSTVTVVGYPIGGNRLSVTRGVVSRIDYQRYAHSSADSHLAIQIDAAINPGNSGGPVIQNRKVVGVAFQGFAADVAQNVGYMIPAPVIQRFLTDIKNGTYDRYVDLGISTFPLLNPAHRKALGLGSGDYGVVVSHVISAGSAEGILHIGDVLLSIDDLPIFSDGTVLMDGRRVDMVEVVERKFKGDSVRLTIRRRGEEMSQIIPLNLPWPYLMLSNQYDVRPRFIVFGGLVFQPLSSNFMKSAQVNTIDLLYHFTLFLDSEIYLDKPEVIVLSRILPDPINTHLRRFVHSIVTRINGKPIRTLEDVFDAFQNPVAFYVIHFVGKSRPVVLERSLVTAARQRILQGYNITSESYLEDSIIPKDWLEKQFSVKNKPESGIETAE